MGLGDGLWKIMNEKVCIVVNVYKVIEGKMSLFMIVEFVKIGIEIEIGRGRERGENMM